MKKQKKTLWKITVTEIILSDCDEEIVIVHKPVYRIAKNMRDAELKHRIHHHYFDHETMDGSVTYVYEYFMEEINFSDLVNK